MFTALFSFASLASATSTARARLVCGLLLAAAPLVAACGGELDEQGAGPQFPQGPIGTTETPPEARADVRPAYAPDQGPAAEDEESMVVVGGEGAPAPIAPAADEYPDTDPSALTDFHAALDPYGQWVQDPTYGTMWEPSQAAVGSDFAPYETAGHWAYGDDYVWMSDYSWGWAPFHYGRWVYASNGWGWIPGRQYAGAWTSWRTGYGAYSGYVGWAPLPPTYGWRNGAAFGLATVPPAAYAFTRAGNLFAPSLAGRMAAGPQVGAIGASSRPTAGAAYGGSNAFAGRTAAHPEVTGPSPQSLRLASSAVTRPPMSNPGLNRAVQFAHPSTAVALGAHAPASGATVARASASAARPYASSMGTSAYGHGYTSSSGFHVQSRTIGGGSSAFSGRSSAFRAPSAFHGGLPRGYSGHPGLHGVAPAAPAAKHPLGEEYGGGYHPRGGGRGGRGGHGGGHR